MKDSIETCFFHGNNSILIIEKDSDEGDYKHAQFRFILSASPKQGGGIILRNENVDARRWKTAVNTVLANSSDIYTIGDKPDGYGILARKWKVRVINKATMRSALLSVREEDQLFGYDKETCEGVHLSYRIHEDDLLWPSDLPIRTSDNDGYAIRYLDGDGCGKASTDNRIFSYLESFLVSDDKVNFHRGSSLPLIKMIILIFMITKISHFFSIISIGAIRGSTK